MEIIVFLLLCLGGYIVWRRATYKPTPPPVVPHIPGPQTYQVDMVGESFYQDNIESICGGRQPDGVNQLVQAVLIPEDDNPYDKKAVKICINGKQVGHLSKEDARKYRKYLKKYNLEGRMCSCNAKIIGGWDRGKSDRGSFGVNLDLVLG